MPTYTNLSYVRKLGSTNRFNHKAGHKQSSRPRNAVPAAQPGREEPSRRSARRTCPALSPAVPLPARPPQLPGVGNGCALRPPAALAGPACRRVLRPGHSRPAGTERKAAAGQAGPGQQASGRATQAQRRCGTARPRGRCGDGSRAPPLPAPPALPPCRPAPALTAPHRAAAPPLPDPRPPQGTCGRAARRRRPGARRAGTAPAAQRGPAAALGALGSNGAAVPTRAEYPHR